MKSPLLVGGLFYFSAAFTRSFARHLAMGTLLTRIASHRARSLSVAFISMAAKTILALSSVLAFIAAKARACAVLLAALRASEVFLISSTLPEYGGHVREAVRMDHSYTSPMPTCDVVDCTNPATDTVPAPGVLGGQLYVCKSDMQKIASGTYTYMVKPEIQKLELRKKS
jgi:hypothetical protein